MQMTFQKSMYEMPDGKYLATFTGVTMKEPTGKLGNDGKPMGPAMTWDFQISEPGEHRGKKADKLTSRDPTPKSGCGKFLVAITDSVLKDGQTVDLTQFYGKTYRITIQENKISDNPAPVRVYDNATAPTGPAPATAPVSPPAAAPTGGPPPRRQAPAVVRYWVSTEAGSWGNPPKPLTVDEIKADWEKHGLAAQNDVQVCKVGTEEWKPISDELKEISSIPF